MPLTDVSPAITTRFLEVQEVLAFIRSNESTEIGVPDATSVIMLRGLFYVHLYGAFEFSINRIVLGAIQVINQAEVPHERIAHPLGVLVLDSVFESLQRSKRDAHWVKRLEVINLRLSSNTAKIHDGCVDLQNIWLATLKEIFAVFGLNRPVMYDVTKQGYIRELVDTRNAVAHGRESPYSKGISKRSSDLEALYNAIRSETFYILDCFSDYLDAREYEMPI